MNSNAIFDIMLEDFPNPDCELVYSDAFTLLVAVVLSAQTTDAAVNKVTPNIFKKYNDVYALAEANLSDVELLIKSIGLYHNKAINIIALSKMLVEDFNGNVPSSMNDLCLLPGVGRKTASVVRSVYFKIPSMPVDTHVTRLSARLGFAKLNDSTSVIESKLKRKIEKDRWIEAHHLLILYGRYKCKAKNPTCGDCKLHEYCKEYKNKYRR